MSKDLFIDPAFSGEDIKVQKGQRGDSGHSTPSVKHEVNNRVDECSVIKKKETCTRYTKNGLRHHLSGE